MCSDSVKCIMCDKEYPNAFICIDNNTQGLGCSCFVSLDVDNKYRIVGCYGSLKHDFHMYMINDTDLIEKIKDKKESICDECVDRLLEENKIVKMCDDCEVLFYE